jgi:hypothetical protein
LYHRISDVIDEVSHKPKSLEPGYSVFITIFRKFFETNWYFTLTMHLYFAIPMFVKAFSFPITNIKTVLSFHVQSAVTLAVSAHITPCSTTTSTF